MNPDLPTKKRDPYVQAQIDATVPQIEQTRAFIAQAIQDGATGHKIMEKVTLLVFLEGRLGGLASA